MQITLLKITDGAKWYFLALKSTLQEDNTYKPSKSFSRLMKNISSNSNENHCCLVWFHSFRTQSKLNEHHELCKSKKKCVVKCQKKEKTFNLINMEQRHLNKVTLF